MYIPQQNCICTYFPWGFSSDGNPHSPLPTALPAPCPAPPSPWSAPCCLRWWRPASSVSHAWDWDRLVGWRFEPKEVWSFFLIYKPYIRLTLFYVYYTIYIYAHISRQQRRPHHTNDSRDPFHKHITVFFQISNYFHGTVHLTWYCARRLHQSPQFDNAKVLSFRLPFEERF